MQDSPVHLFSYQYLAIPMSLPGNAPKT